MANYIITKNKAYFEAIGDYLYCNLEDMILPDRIAFDSETTGLVARKNEMFCCQIGTGENNYIIHMYDGNYSFSDVQPYIEDRELVGANILFDLGFCYKLGFFPKKVRDVMLATRIIYNGDVINRRADFSSMMKRELGIIYDKTEQANIARVKLSQASTISYSFQDVDRLLELHDALEKKIDKGGFRATYDLHCRYIRALAYMEQCGLGISSEAWKRKMEEDIKNCSIAQKQIEEYIYDNIPKFRNEQLDMFSQDKKIKISLTSPLQMLKVFKELGIDTKDKDGKNSINENIISKSGHEFVAMWLAFQESNHRISTFGEGIYSQIENERIYTNFNPMVDTARLSTRKGNINFLNFPADKATRGCFHANKGNVMVVCDYAGQETVVGADLSRDGAMMNSVINNEDLHCMFARVLYPELQELSDEEIIENHKDKRQASKSPRFCFQFGGAAYTLHQNEGIPLERCKEIEAGFKELHAGLYEWGEAVYQEAIKKGWIESADGWKLKLPKFDMFKELKEKIETITKYEWSVYREGKLESKRHYDNPEYIIKNENAYNFYKSKKSSVSNYFKLKGEYFRLSLNNPVQARAAHQLKRATCLIFEWIERNNLLWKVLIDNSIHDELILECGEELGEIVAKNLSKFMIEAGNHYLTNLTINAEAKFNISWEKAK